MAMIASVSTVKDSPKDIQAFVRRNLKRGIDHMFVFLDDGDRESAAALERNPHVTYIETTADWWRGERPDDLNRRQGINANLVKALLSDVASVAWLFHIDSDEVVDLDREQLLGLAPDIRAVSLQTLEAVSQRRQRRAPREFKRPLDDDELVLLRTLGVLDKPSNKEYFRGHLVGKAGLRPTLDLRFGIHRVVDPAGEKAETHQAEWLRVLHLHSPSRDLFVRRWQNLLSSGPAPGLRQKRSRLATSLAVLSELDLPRSTLQRYLTRLYDCTTADDVRVLRDLRLLERIDVEQQIHTPLAMPADDLRRVRQRLERLRLAEKSIFRGGPPDQVREALQQATV